MILRGLKLRNYRQHANLDVKLDGTIIAVVGPNGSGKSNLLGAVQFAFSGEQTGFKKSDLLRWGSDAGEAIVEFEHNGIQGEISRSVHNATASLRLGKETFRGATAVAEALKTHLDMDKDLVKQVVFVRQAEIDAILFTDPSVREKSFHRLMGIGDAAQIYRVLGDTIGELDSPQNYDEQIAEGKRRSEDIDKRMRQARTQSEDIKKQIADLPPIGTLKQGINAAQARIQAIARVRETRKNVVCQNEVAQKTEQRLNELPAVTDNLSDLDKQCDVLRASISEAKQYRQAFAAWKTAGEAVLAVGSPPVSQEDIAEAQRKYTELSACANKFLGELQLRENLKNALRSGAALKLETCPVCGAAVTDKEALLSRLTSVVDEMKEKARALKRQETDAKTELDNGQGVVARFQKTRTEREAAYAQADSALKAVKEAHADLEALSAEIGALQTRRQRLLDAVIARTSLETKLRTELDHCATLESAASAAMTAATTLGLRAEEIDNDAAIAALQRELQRCEALREALQRLETESARLGGTLTELEDTAVAVATTTANLEHKRATQQTLRDAISTLSNVRSWFHYANGPRTLSTSMLGVLNQDVNRFLSRFSAPFTVEPSQDTLGFRCAFTDGRPMPADGTPDASMLSGGQKIQLAVAFRFAAYCMFASKLGLLSLDEPTAYLDDANVGRFCDLLQHVKRVASGMNLQVLLATHERSVIQFCDTVIDLGEAPRQFKAGIQDKRQ